MPPVRKELYLIIIPFSGYRTKLVGFNPKDVSDTNQNDEVHPTQ